MDMEKDDFSTALADAINRPTDDDDTDLDLASGADDDDPQPRTASTGGGDVDDEPSPAPRIDYAREAVAKLQEAEQTKQQWAAYYQEQEAKLKAAQEAHRAARKKVLEDDSDANMSAEDEALNAIMEARLQIEKARDGYQKWSEHANQLANAPKLSAAEQAWLDANPQYLSDTRFSEQAKKVMVELKHEGLDPTHQTFYRRLDDRLRSPGRIGQNSRRTPGAPAVRTASRTADSGEVMTREEAGFIRKLGRDPSDPAVKAQWKISKANTRRVAQMQGAFR